MRRQLVFDFIAFDSMLLEQGKQQYNFFQDTGEDHESVTSMSEAVAIEWLMSNQLFRNMFIQKLLDTPSRAKTYTGLKEPFTRHHFKPGDIDLLLFDKAKPELAIAFECKRVKAISESKAVSKVNNAKKIRDGVVQANFFTRNRISSTLSCNYSSRRWAASENG